MGYFGLTQSSPIVSGISASHAASLPRLKTLFSITYYQNPVPLYNYKQNGTVLREFKKLNISVVLAGQLLVAMAGSTSVASTPAAAANDFTAAKVMNEMKPDERAAYFAGVVEGLAIARYMKDGKQNAGMNCIYSWYYDDKQTLRLIHDAFDKYPSYPPGSIMDVLVRQKCGE
jgi:hypothetical protein